MTKIDILKTIEDFTQDARLCNKAIIAKFRSLNIDMMTFDSGVPMTDNLSVDGQIVKYHKYGTTPWKFWIEGREISYRYDMREDRIHFYPWHIIAYLKSIEPDDVVDQGYLESELKQLASKGQIEAIKVGQTDKLIAYSYDDTKHSAR